MKIFRNNISYYKSLSVVALLGIYISVLLFNNLHSYFHKEHHNQEICTAEAEKNPCHKRVIHHSLAEGCKHKTHIFSLEKTCKLCDAVITKYYFPGEKVFSQSKKKLIQTALIFEEPFVFKFSTTSKRLRGPPSFSSFFAQSFSIF